MSCNSKQEYTNKDHNEHLVEFEMAFKKNLK